MLLRTVKSDKPTESTVSIQILVKEPWKVKKYLSWHLTQVHRTPNHWSMKEGSSWTHPYPYCLLHLCPISFCTLIPSPLRYDCERGSIWTALGQNSDPTVLRMTCPESRPYMLSIVTDIKGESLKWNKHLFGPFLTFNPCATLVSEPWGLTPRLQKALFKRGTLFSGWAWFCLGERAADEFLHWVHICWAFGEKKERRRI